MSNNLHKEVQSPCIGVCVVDDGNQLCQGCFRTLDEIQDWWELDSDQKQKIVEEASLRATDPFD